MRAKQKKTALCKPTNNKLTNGLLFALVHNYNQNINQPKKWIKHQSSKTE